MVWAPESIYACKWVEYDRQDEVSPKYKCRTVVDSNWCFDNLCSSIFRVKVSCITSAYGIKL